jgi:hypothetical protein
MVAGAGVVTRSFGEYEMALEWLKALGLMLEQLMSMRWDAQW